MAYNPQLRYATFTFTITPELAERLPIPGGFYSGGPVYNCIPDGRIERKSIYMIRNEENTRTDSLFINRCLLTHYTVQICCPTRGDVEGPRNLDEVKAFAKGIILDKPIPEWYFQVLDELREVEATATVSNVRLRKVHSSDTVETYS
jgi:hypothetical protein